MPKNGKPTLEKLEKLLNVVATNVAEIKSEVTDMKSVMVTKDDLRAFATKDDLMATEIRLSAKIEGVDQKIDWLEEIDVRGLQSRVSVLEKDVKNLKHGHG